MMMTKVMMTRITTMIREDITVRAIDPEEAEQTEAVPIHPARKEVKTHPQAEEAEAHRAQEAPALHQAEEAEIHPVRAVTRVLHPAAEQEAPTIPAHPDEDLQPCLKLSARE